VDVVLGGVDTSKAPEDPDAPVLAVDGVAVLGGIAVGGKAGPASDS
jgi:hypothetical protein